ncbi:MAG: hypothetical protein ACKV2T_28765 [Kofleriaceae bacterium]
MLICGSAAADVPVLPTLPTPPKIDQKQASGFNLTKRMELWYQILTGRGCILSETNPAGQIQNLGTMISNHRDRTEQAALLEYFNNHLVPHGTARLAGVPGFGTWAEIAAKKNASFDWMKANLPQGPADTADQAKAYIAAYQAFRTRVTEDHAYGKALLAASSCHESDQAPTGRPQGVEPFTIWVHLTAAPQLEAALAPVRDKIVPQTLPGEAEAQAVLNEAKSATLDRLFIYGKLLKNAYSAYGTLERGKPTAERMSWFATLYDGDRAVQMAGAPARVIDLQAQLAALVLKLIPNVKPAPSVGGGPAGIVKKALTGKHILASRATSSIRNADKVTTDQRTLTETTALVRTYRIAFTAFDVQWVTAAKEGWLDLPGLPVAKVCALHSAIMRKYSKGVDVQLNKWLVEQGDVLSPMLCAERTSTSSFAE